MGILFMASADLQALDLWSVTSGATLSTTQARTGARSYRLGGGDYLQKSLASAGPFYLRAAVLTTIGLTGTPYCALLLREGTTTHVNVQLNFSSGAIRVGRGAGSGDEISTLLGTSAAGLLTPNAWAVVEVYAVAHDTMGAVTVKVNGVTVLTLTGVDTRNGGAGVIDNLRIVNWLSSYTYIDDVIVRDDGWPGRGGIYVLTPTGAGANADLTPSAGDPYACVDELPPTFDDYLSGASDDTGAIHDLALSALPAGLEIFGGVGVLAYARLATAGSGALNVGYIDTPGSEAQYSADVALSQSAQWVAGYFAQNASAADFTATQVGRLTAALKIATEP